jgi:hypothetical protein
MVCRLFRSKLIHTKRRHTSPTPCSQARRENAAATVQVGTEARSYGDTGDLGVFYAMWLTVSDRGYYFGDLRLWGTVVAPLGFTPSRGRCSTHVH